MMPSGSMKNAVDEVFWRLLWLSMAMALLAYGSSLFFQSVINSQDESTVRRIVATDRVGVGVHHLSGFVPVPSPCHALSVKVRQMAHASYHLTFDTWQEPYRDCTPETVYRRFHAVTFGPSVGSHFSASVDGKPYTLTVLQVKSK